MSEQLTQKIQRAQKLRQKLSFPFSLFNKPDFIESGDLFCEIAKESSSKEEQVKFYIEAANTFCMKKDEYGEFCASECYRKLFEILEEIDIERALKYYTMYAESLEKMSKYLTAGQTYTKIADILAKIDPKRATDVYSKAVLTYKKDRASCTYHLKACLQNFLNVQLELENIEGSIEIFDHLDIKYSKLCKQILTILTGRSDFDDVLSPKENQLVMALLNKEKEDAIKDLEAFRTDNYLPEQISKVFDLAIQRMSPENDIC
jgi:hypothetical protein